MRHAYSLKIKQKPMKRKKILILFSIKLVCLYKFSSLENTTLSIFINIYQKILKLLEYIEFDDFLSGFKIE